MAFGDDDLSAMVADVFSVAITFGAQSARGILNQAGTLVGAGGEAMVNLTERSVTIQTGDLTSLVQDGAITVDGTAYQIRDTQPLDDGKLTVIWLSP